MKFLYFTYFLLAVISVLVIAGLYASGNWIWLIAYVASLIYALAPPVPRHPVAK